ncbi:MAG: TonB family protein [Gemmatimonadales bacterium]|nr:TonB family protein [Gemmatimonadales bacterium]
MRMVLLGLVLAAGAGACREGGERSAQLPQPGADRRDQTPISVNADPPVQYPPELYERGVEGTVILRLFVDSTGTVIADSTRIQEPSGHAALDSAALAAVPSLRFAPALRDGVPVSTAFEQPIIFQPTGSGEAAP